MVSSYVLEQILQQYGLIGLLITLLIAGPIFTYFRTRHSESQAEIKAQELIHRFAWNEQERSRQLEEQLNTTLLKLTAAEEEVMRLKQDLTEAQRQVVQLTREVEELKHLVEAERTENKRLRYDLRQRQTT